MSVFIPGNGSLFAITKPAALFELALAIVLAELSAAIADPTVSARNVATTVSFDTGLIAINASIPIVPIVQNSGKIRLLAIDYLGAPYSTFNNGNGDLKSTNLIAAFVEMAQILAAGETRRPADDRPNQIQVTADLEGQRLAIDVALPFTSAATATGDVVIKAVDYLYEPAVPVLSAAGVAYTASQSSVPNTSPAVVGSYTSLTDGDRTTGAGTGTTGLDFIQATFPQPVRVAAVQLGGGYLTDFGPIAGQLNGAKVQYSTDNAVWTDAFTIAGVADGGVNEFKTFPMGSPVIAQYWRILGGDYLATSEFKFT